MQIAGILSMSSLADFLRQEQEKTSYRRLQEKTGVSRGALENIIKGDNKDLPELESLIKISNAYGIELYRVVEMLGIDLQLPRDAKSESLRLAVTLERMPMLRAVVERIITLSETRIKPILDMLQFHLTIEDRPEEGGLSPEAIAWLNDHAKDEEARKDLERAIQEAKARRERDDLA